MGWYSSTQKLYLTSSDEVVDVEAQLNYNLRRLDSRVRRLVEYQVAQTDSISNEFSERELGMKWYKKYSNSFWVHNGTSLVQANPNAQVDEWTPCESALENGWANLSSYPESNIAYRKNSAGIVHWRGRIALNNYDAFSPNIISHVMTIPSDALPSRSKYFTVDTGTDQGVEFADEPSLARMYFGTNANCEMNLFGVSPGSNGSQANTLLFDDVWYPTDD